MHQSLQPCVLAGCIGSEWLVGAELTACVSSWESSPPVAPHMDGSVPIHSNPLPDAHEWRGKCRASTACLNWVPCYAELRFTGVFHKSHSLLPLVADAAATAGSNSSQWDPDFEAWSDHKGNS